MASSQEITWGSAQKVNFKGRRVPLSLFEQGVPRVGSGAEVERPSQAGLSKMKFASFDGGLVARSGIQPWTAFINTYQMNQGIQTRFPGLAILPYVLTAQTGLGGDTSTARASNQRVHAFNTSLGAGGLRYGFALGNRVFLDTSLTDPAIAELSGSAFTDLCTAIEEQAVFNNTRYAAFAYNGTTQDVRGFSSISGLDYSTGWSTLINLSAGDYVNAMRYMQGLGSGTGVLVGKVGGTNGVHYWQGSDSIPASTHQVVLGATSGDFGFQPVENTGVINLTLSDDFDPPNQSPWGAFVSSGGVASRSYGYKWGTPTSAIDIPDDAEIVGIEIKWRYNVDIGNIGTGSATWSSSGGRVTVGGNVVSAPAGSEGSRTDFDNRTINKTIGGSSNPLGTHLTGREAKAIGVRIGPGYITTSSAGDHSVNISNGTIQIWYRRSGHTLAFPTGGWQVAPSPSFPNRIAMVAPENSEETGITSPRKLWFLDFGWDGTGERPIFSVSTPELLGASVWHAAPWQGGYVVIGSHRHEPGEFVYHIDGQGLIRDMRFPGWNGKEFKANAVIPLGKWLAVDCVTPNGNDRQWWIYGNGRWYPDTIWQSLSQLGTSNMPIPFAEVARGIHQEQLYSVFPHSSATAVSRQFFPSDAEADPRIFDSGETKSMAWDSGTETNWLLLRSHELDWGPEEATKSIIAADYQSWIGAAGNEVRSRLSVDGDHTFASPGSSYVFDGSFEHYDVPNYGLPYRTLIHELGMKHTAGTANTPNGTGVLYTAVHQWPHLVTIEVEIDNLGLFKDIFAFEEALQALQAANPVRPLKIGSRTWWASYDGIRGILKAPVRGSNPTPESLRYIDAGQAQDYTWHVRFRMVSRAKTPGDGE